MYPKYGYVASSPWGPIAPELAALIDTLVHEYNRWTHEPEITSGEYAPCPNETPYPRFASVVQGFLHSRNPWTRVW